MNIAENKNLADLTRLGIGGPADFFVEAKTPDELAEAVEFAKAKSLPWLLMAEGTNLLVSDAGFRGLVIKYSNNQIELDVEQLSVRAGAGVNLLELIEQTIARGWAGMESMYGIPGTVGAGVYGNVGAYGTEIKDVVVEALVWDGQQIKVFSNQDCKFEYRSSIFKTHKDWIVLSVTLKFTPGSDAELVTKAQEIMQTRLLKYPEGLKCPGSFFKNIILANLTDGQLDKIGELKVKSKAGKLASGVLLEAAGVKGMSVGDAKVADYHGNLIYNAGHATAKDVDKLAQQLKDSVKQQFGIDLEAEVQFVGEFN